jgi:hypothetical protein
MSLSGRPHGSSSSPLIAAFDPLGNQTRGAHETGVYSTTGPTETVRYLQGLINYTDTKAKCRHLKKIYPVKRLRGRCISV